MDNRLSYVIFISLLCYVYGGSTPYNWNTQICCNGNLFNRSSNVGCCLNNTYRADRQVCCDDGSVVNKSNVTGDQICCGGRAVDRNPRQLCCGGRMVAINTSYDANPFIYRCCGSTPYSYLYEGCCGTRVYNSATQSCCNGQIINSTTQICCNGVVVNKIYGSQSNCCGTQVLNTATQQCCEETIVDYPKDSSCPFYEYRCCGRRLMFPDQQCCNDTIFNPVVDEAQNPYYPVCCGNAVVHDTASELCCNGVVRIDKPYLQCCAGVTYDPTISICCYDKVIYHDGSQPLACCGRETFIVGIVGNQVCCDGKVYNGTTGENTCCYN